MPQLKLERVMMEVELTTMEVELTAMMGAELETIEAVVLMMIAELLTVHVLLKCFSTSMCGMKRNLRVVGKVILKQID